jgi:hypothetical protein
MVRQRCSPVALLVMVALTSACGKDSPTAPTPTAANVAPTIATMAVSQSAYRTARLTATTSDSDGRVVTAMVDWGNGSTSDVSSSAANINVTHRYNRAQSYTVTLRVVDDAGASTEQSRSVTITVPEEACVGIKVVEVCAQSTADFRNLQVAVRAGSVALASATISEGNPSIALPLLLGFGRLTLAHNFTTGRLTISGEVCPIPFLVCEPVGSVPIQF